MIGRIKKFYSQYGEDRALLSLFGRKSRGYFVEVGAQDGVRNSNTYLFELLGWKGICVEPHSRFFPRLKKNRPGSICLKVAAWDRNAETCDFYATKTGGWSRVGSPGKSEVVEIQHPPTRTLNHILGKYGTPRNFEILSIDVEGTEWHVLRGFTLKRYMPRVVIIEYRIVKKGFKKYFGKHGYVPVNRRRSCNTIYCRNMRDAKIICKSWKGVIG